MKTNGSESVLQIKFVPTLDPFEIMDGHWKALSVDLPQVGAEVSHELPVGEEHHLGAGQVQGVGPGPPVVQEVLQAVELSLHYGELTPGNRHALA